jgi:hypothetical protein
MTSCETKLSQVNGPGSAHKKLVLLPLTLLLHLRHGELEALTSRQNAIINDAINGGGAPTDILASCQ